MKRALSLKTSIQLTGFARVCCRKPTVLRVLRVATPSPLTALHEVRDSTGASDEEWLPWRDA